jgi:hypothetical protein
LKQPVQPKVLRAVSTPDIDQIAGDATGAYPQELGLKRFGRQLLFVKPDVLIVVDDISVNRETPLELRFHPEDRAEQNGNTFVAHGPRAALRLELLTAEGVQAEAQSLPLPGRHGREGAGLSTIRLSTKRAEWRNAVALSWASASKQPAHVALKTEEQRWSFSIADRTLSWDWNTETGRLISGKSRD